VLAVIMGLGAREGKGTKKPIVCVKLSLVFMVQKHNAENEKSA
jgi:hypothetical protein